LAVGNLGGDVNYFLERIVALALAVPLAWSAVETRIAPRPLWIAPVAGLVQLLLLFHVPNGFMASYTSGPAMGSTPVAEDVAVGDRIEGAIRRSGSNALVELAGFSVLVGAPVWLQPIDLQAEAQRARWNPELVNSS